MARFRYLKASDAAESPHHDGFHPSAGETRKSIEQGVSSFMEAFWRPDESPAYRYHPEFRDERILRRQVPDTRSREGLTLLDYVGTWLYGWKSAEQSVPPTYEEYLLAIIGILDYSIYRDALDHGYVHPALVKSHYELARRANQKAIERSKSSKD
jgi:hypothetical protein